MLAYSTIHGKQLPLSSLTETEFNILLYLVDIIDERCQPETHVGRLLLNQALDIDSSTQLTSINPYHLPEPSVFCHAWLAHLKQSLWGSDYAHAIIGPLHEILMDLTLRIGQIANGWQLGDGSDPSLLFLTQLLESRGITQLAQDTGLSKSKLTKALGAACSGESKLRVNELSQAASNLDLAVEYRQKRAEALPRRATLRDLSQQRLGMRVFALVTALRPFIGQEHKKGRRHLRELLRLEYLVRTGETSDALDCAIRSAYMLSCNLMSETPNSSSLLVVQLPTGMHQQVDGFGWIFSALELGYFDGSGLVFAITDSIPVSGLQILSPAQLPPAIAQQDKTSDVQTSLTNAVHDLSPELSIHYPLPETSPWDGDTEKLQPILKVIQQRVMQAKLNLSTNWIINEIEERWMTVLSMKE